MTTPNSTAPTRDNIDAAVFFLLINPIIKVKTSNRLDDAKSILLIPIVKLIFINNILEKSYKTEHFSKKKSFNNMNLFGLIRRINPMRIKPLYSHQQLEKKLSLERSRKRFERNWLILASVILIGKLYQTYR